MCVSLLFFQMNLFLLIKICSKYYVVEVVQVRLYKFDARYILKHYGRVITADILTPDAYLYPLRYRRDAPAIEELRCKFSRS